MARDSETRKAPLAAAPERANQLGVPALSRAQGSGRAHVHGRQQSATSPRVALDEIDASSNIGEPFMPALRRLEQ
jgi:hypothetical protein